MRVQRAIAAELRLAKTDREHHRLVTVDPPALHIEPPEDAIRLRSQQIWESEGRPEGHAQDHWARARAELAQQMAKMANRPQDGIVQPVPAAVAPEPAPQADAVVEKAPDALLADLRDHVTSAGPLAWLLPSTKRSAVPSIICSGLVFRGELDSPGELHFDGQLEGDIRAADLHVGEHAVIQGEVMASTVTVHGSIRGRIRARHVVLRAGSRVVGDIEYGTLTVQSGAQLDGRFRHA